MAHMTFKSHNVPTHRMRHQNFEVFLHEAEEENEDFKFVLVAGLADPNKVSFESANYPGFFIRHSSFRIVVNENDGSDIFKADATFEMVRPNCGAEGREWMSFRSVNFADRFLRHKNFELWLDEAEGDNFDEDSTFALEYYGTQMLRSLNVPTHAVRHQDFECFNHEHEPGNQTFDFLIRPGLQSGLGVSFESVNLPNYFLRHSGFRLLLNEHDGSEVFDNDATFAITMAVAGESNHFSLNSVNFPDRFLRHKDFEIWLDPMDERIEDFAWAFD